jgi:hypothetical protein
MTFSVEYLEAAKEEDRKQSYQKIVRGRIRGRIGGTEGY